jgi:hypothetical protein
MQSHFNRQVSQWPDTLDPQASISYSEEAFQNDSLASGVTESSGSLTADPLLHSSFTDVSVLNSDNSGNPLSDTMSSYETNIFAMPTHFASRLAGVDSYRGPDLNAQAFEDVSLPDLTGNETAPIRSLTVRTTLPTPSPTTVEINTPTTHRFVQPAFSTENLLDPLSNIHDIGHTDSDLEPYFAENMSLMLFPV